MYFPVKKLSAIVVFLLISCGNIICFAQDNADLKQLVLQRIATQQAHNDTAFMPGLFPSYIEKNKQLHVADNNIYFTALIAYTLNTVKVDLDENEWPALEMISANAAKLYPHFQNAKGRNTYNFWRTDKTFFFPYWTLPEENKNEEKKRLPDDFDDTAMILLASEAPDSLARKVHLLMQDYTNNKKKRVRGAASYYQEIPAYSVWFGKKFPVIFDVCVGANVLSFVNTYNLDWTRADSATLQLIVQTIKHNDHIKKPVNVAPYYARTSIILYHIARLMSIQAVPELEALKPGLIIDALNELKNADSYIEKVILHSSLLRWGYSLPDLELPAENELFKTLETPSIPFFVGNLPSYLPGIIQKPLLMTNTWMYNHFCPAYYNALFLEYLVLKDKNEALTKQ